MLFQLNKFICATTFSRKHLVICFIVSLLHDMLVLIRILKLSASISETGFYKCMLLKDYRQTEYCTSKGGFEEYDDATHVGNKRDAPRKS